MSFPQASPLLALVVSLSYHSDAWAGDDEGHKVICEIAFRVAQPSTHAEIQRLIRTDTEFERFSNSCIWPGPHGNAPRSTS